MYELYFHAMVERLFKSQFLNHCRKYPGVFHSVPVTRGRVEVAEDENTHFVAPRDGAPVVLYRQGPKDGCMFCGLASALAYFGDKTQARAIYDLQEEAKSNLSDWNLILHRMRSDYHTVRNENREQYIVNEDPWHHCLLFVVLEGEDGSTSHSVTICNGFIFDANVSHALKYSKKSLDWCCSAPGYSTRFLKFYRAVYFYPKKFSKFHRIPERQHAIFGEINLQNPNL